MAPSFFNKLVKAGTPSPATTSDEPTTATTDTKPLKRHCRDRSGSNKSTKSGKSRQPSVDNTSSSPRASFQFGLPTLGPRRAPSTHSTVPQSDIANAPSPANSTAHKKSSSVTAVPPVPPLPDTLKVGLAPNTSRSRRNSIISAFGGGRNKDRNPEPSTTSGSTTTKGNKKSNSQDSDGIPDVAIVVSPSRESLATTSTGLGVTVVPPSPLIYTSSLASSSVDLQVDNPADILADEPEEEFTALNFPTTTPNAVPETPVTSPTTPTPTPGANTTADNSAASVLVSLFGQRVRRASISSAISGFIGGRPEITIDSPSETLATTPPTTAATVKSNPFNLPVDDSKSSSSGAMSQANGGLMPAQELQRKASSRSLTNVPPPLNLQEPNFPSTAPTRNGHHPRSATSPPDAFRDESSGTGAVTMSPIVESPTGFKSPDFPSPAGSSSKQTAASNGGFSTLLSPRKVDDDAASIISTSSKVSPDKKRPWKRSNTRKPTGLAGAIAATGLAMANPGVASPVYSPTAAPMLNMASSTSQGSKANGSTPYLSKSPARSASSAGRKSSTSVASPKSGSSKKGKHHRRPSGSAFSDGGLSAGVSEYHSGNDSDASRMGGRRKPTRSATERVAAALGFDSGSESDTEDETDSSDDSSSEDDILDGLDLEDDDMPVTGFAVASNKRNADFHELFPNIPEGDYLIEDYGCALQREILIQGRLYISENHVCFHANIFGWITDLSIPTSEIISLEKKMTAFVIPNALQISTRQAKYQFSSFLSRDTTFDVIYNIWRVSRPTDYQSIGSGRASLEGGSESVININGAAEGAGQVNTMHVGQNGAPAAKAGKQNVRKATQCTCGKEGRHYTETALEAVFPGSPEKIHNLIFASGFIKDFLVVDQKVTDIQMSDWMPVEPGSKLLTRTMSYIKPLNASMGPKSTKCEIKDENDHVDFDHYVSTVTTTRTPDVPSGGVFSVKTRTCIMWESAVSSRVVVTTQVDWTGRSFIKGIIERSAIDGQKVFHGDLDKGMRKYIQDHPSEFVPEGMDASALAAPPPDADVPPQPLQEEGAPRSKETTSEEERNKQREHERNRRAFQWAWDTFEGAFEVAERSTKGAVELVRDAWDQSSSTTILYFVIVTLVISNIWTLVKMGKKEEIGRRKEMMKAEERERWVQSVVMTLWEELSSGKQLPQVVGGGQSGPAPLQPAPPSAEQIPNDSTLPQSPPTSSVVTIPPPQTTTLLPGSVEWRVEVAQLQESLSQMEERIRALRAALADLEAPPQINELD